MSSATRHASTSNRLVSRSQNDIPLPITSSLSASTTSNSTNSSRSNIQRLPHSHSKHKNSSSSLTPSITALTSSSNMPHLSSNASTNLPTNSKDKPHHLQGHQQPSVFSFYNADLPLSVQLKRFWKKLNEKDPSGKRSMLSQAFKAFKMGLYFKVFITIVLIIRISIHSSQRSLPTNAVLYDDYYYSSLQTIHANNSTNARLLVITKNGYSTQLHSVLTSLADAQYGGDRVSIDVFLYSSSACNILPIFLYPLAVAIFGPPRYDHSLAATANALHWPHGDKNIVAVKTEPDLVHAWQSTYTNTNETLIFVDLVHTASVSPSFYMWLKGAKAAAAFRSHVVSLDTLSLPSTLDRAAHPNYGAVLSQQFFPAAAIFSPSQDVWINFQKWFSIRVVGKGYGLMSSLKAPTLLPSLRLGGYKWWLNLKEWPSTAWFAMYLAEYDEKVTYPLLHGDRSLLTRPYKSTRGDVAGSGEVSYSSAHFDVNSRSSFVHLSQHAENEAKLLDRVLSPTDIHVPHHPYFLHVNFSMQPFDLPPSVFHYLHNGSVVVSSEAQSPAQHRAPPHSHQHRTIFSRTLQSLRGAKTTAYLQDILRDDVHPEIAVHRYKDVVHELLQRHYGGSTGKYAVSLVFVPDSEAVLKMSMNWICNVEALGIVPTNLAVLGATDHVTKRIGRILATYPRLHDETLLVSLQDILLPPGPPDTDTNPDANGDDAARQEDGIWRLTLLRAMMQRDLLSAGLSVLAVDARQLWLNNPLPYVRHELHPGRVPVGPGGLHVSTGAASSIEDYRVPDVVAATAASPASYANARNVLYMRGTAPAVHLAGKLVDKLWQSFVQYEALRASAASSDPRSFRGRRVQRRLRARRNADEEWAALLSALLSGRDAFYVRRFPRPKIAALHHDLFVDGSWFADLDSRRSSKAYPAAVAAWPVVASNDRQSPPSSGAAANVPSVESEERSKVRVAKRFGYWFLASTDQCDERAVRSALKSGHHESTDIRRRSRAS